MRAADESEGGGFVEFVEGLDEGCSVDIRGVRAGNDDGQGAESGGKRCLLRRGGAAGLGDERFEAAEVGMLSGVVPPHSSRTNASETEATTVTCLQIILRPELSHSDPLALVRPRANVRYGVWRE